MNGLAGIRQRYRPVQPTAVLTDGRISYTEVMPAPELQDMIYCYWQLSTSGTLPRPFTYRVVADGCIDIFFAPGCPGENYVMGFCRQYTEFPLGHTFHYAGVRFLPTMFPQLFGHSAALLSNRVEQLARLAPEVDAFLSRRFDAAATSADLQAGLDECFLPLRSRARFDEDHRLYDALALILECSGAIDIERDICTGLSPRQLRRHFAYYIGATPKAFAQVVRFQHLLHADPTAQRLRQQKLFLDAGYFDQAHFIREFRTFYGDTPARALRR